MTGRALLEAMDYVDEKYVDEAEFAALPRVSRVPIRHIAALAACVCLLLTGAAMFALSSLSGKSTDMAMDSVFQQNGSASPEENAVSYGGNSDSTAQEAPFLLLRLEDLTDGGYGATVVGASDPETFPEGMYLTVKVDTPPVESDIAEDADEKPSFPAGTLIRVEYGAYDPETGILTLTDWSAVEQIPPEEEQKG